MAQQHTHHTTAFNIKAFPIVLVCDNLSSPANCGAIFRLADAFGIQEIAFCGKAPNLNSSRLKSLARNAEKTVAHTHADDCANYLKQLKKDGFQIIALEITQSSKPINHSKIDIKKPIALVIGNEKFGVSESVLKITHNAVHINMYGVNRSMNVAQATAIALYEITNQQTLSR